jgi:hypothetical protein
MIGVVIHIRDNFQDLILEILQTEIKKIGQIVVEQTGPKQLELP